MMQAPAMIPAIELRGLSKSFGRAPVLQGIDLTVGSGEVVGLLGPNGSGKTTTLRIIAGLLAADGGEVLVGGRPLDPEDPAGRRRIGYLPERTPLYEALTVKETLAFAAAAKGIAKSARGSALERVAAAFALEGALEKPVSRLSKGFRQRVGLAQACLGEPQVLLLDEATNGLDPLQVIEARRMILAAAKDCAVLFCSHLMQEVAALCSRAVILKDGRVRGEVPLHGGAGEPRLEVRLVGIELEWAAALVAQVEGIAKVDPWPASLGEVALGCRLAPGAGDDLAHRVAAALLPHGRLRFLGFARTDLEARFLQAIEGEGTGC